MHVDEKGVSIESYRGEITSLPEGKPYAFIDLRTVTKSNDEPHDIDTDTAIFLHRTECDSPLEKGMLVTFLVKQAKRKRETSPSDKASPGKPSFRALRARRYTPPLTLEVMERSGVQLILQSSDGTRGLEHSNLFLRWCLNPTLVAFLKDLSSKEFVARLLIVRWKDGLREWTETRDLVNPTDPLAYVTFDRPGKHHVVAFIVYDKNEMKLRDKYLTYRRNEYTTTILSYSDDEIILDQENAWTGGGYVTAEIPEGLFAAEPLDWKWVNLWFSNPPRDQCAFRWRRLLAYTIQPVGMLIFVMFLGVVGCTMWIGALALISFLLVCGCKNINYEFLKHPWDEPFSEIMIDIDETALAPRLGGQRVFFPLMLSFPALAMTFLISALTYSPSSGDPWEWVAYVWLVGFATLSVVSILWWGLWTLMGRGDPFEALRAEIARKERERLAYQAELDLLACSGEQLQGVGVRTLRFAPRNFRFFALALKEKVCRGYAAY